MAYSNDSTSAAGLGARLRALRRRRGMTREQLAEKACVSAETVKAIEQGRRNLTIPMLYVLAEALDVSPSELTDRHPRLPGGQDHEASVLEIRDVIQSPASVGVLPEDDGPPMTPAEVRAGVAAASAAYWAGDFTSLAGVLPGLITSARAAREREGPPMAEPLALARDLAAALLVHLGKEDLALVAAERALTAARDGGDELLQAVLAGNVAWVMLHQGRLGDAERVAVAAADAARKVRYRDRDVRDAAHGSLLLTAVGPAAAAGADVSGYLAEARRIGEGLGRRVRVWQTSFAPASVTMQAVYAYAVQRLPGRALAEAQRMRPADLPGVISQGRHLLDVAQAAVDAGYYGQAVDTLTQAMDLAPVWFGHQEVSRLLVDQLMGRRLRMRKDDPLARLAAAAGSAGCARYYRPGS